MSMGRGPGSSTTHDNCEENKVLQFARPEFSVFQSGVSSSTAVTTYPVGKLVYADEMFQLW